MKTNPLCVDPRYILRLPSALRLALVDSGRSFSVLNRPPRKYEGHVPLTNLERGALAAGSAVMSLLNPRRGGTYVYFPVHLSSVKPNACAL